MSMRLRWHRFGDGQLHHLDMDIATSSAWLGYVTRTQKRPNTYKAVLRAPRRKYHSTNLRRAKAWLITEARRELAAVARKGAA